MHIPLIKLCETRVRRQYLGGGGIEKIHGRPAVDSHLPEEWIASMVEANNPEMPAVENEGLTAVYQNRNELLKDIIKSDPMYYLGKSQTEKIGSQIGVLVKILDSAVRLPIQAHPTKEYAKRELNSIWGKSEAYYILDVRENVEPYILLGFNHDMSRNEWKKLVNEQDIVNIIKSLNKVNVKKGEVWFIPSGAVHAIGEGITMLEIMEPSDLVVRCEFKTVNGNVFPQAARFMGKDIDDIMDIFDYSGYSIDEIRKKANIAPAIVKRTESYTEKIMLPAEKTNCFAMNMLEIKASICWNKADTVNVAVITDGKGKIMVNDVCYEYSAGDSFLIPAEVANVNFYVDSNTCVCAVSPSV